MAGALGAGSGSQCSEISLRTRILDESVRPGVEVSSADQITDPHFRAFVFAITELLSSRLSESRHCTDSSAVASELQFIRYPLATSGDEPLAPIPLLEPGPSADCWIGSPWLQFGMGRRPVSWVRGIFLWSERQLLQDQAVLTGSKAAPPSRLEPLTRSEFERLAQDYANSEILRLPVSAQPPLEARIPPDVLWLFRHSWQSTRGPFSGSASGAMSAALKRGAPSYTALARALIDRCFAPGSSVQQYGSVLDVQDAIPLEQYRIDQLY
jgi:hypothetical protein